jgi:hypothetical protein
MNNKIQHKIYWEINTTTPSPSGVFSKIIEKFGHKKTEVHTYVMDIELTTSEGDSLESTLSSVIRQLKTISTSDDQRNNKIVAHNGIKRVQFVKK